MFAKTREPKLDSSIDSNTIYSAAAIEGDPSRYFTFPHLPGSALTTLVDKLLLAVGDDAHALVHEAAERLRKDNRALKAALIQNLQATPVARVRAPFDRLVRLMSAAFQRTVALAELEESGEDFEAARFLIAHIFPTRLDFTHMSAWDVVGEVEIRMSILKDGTTEEAFDRVAGSTLRGLIGEALLELKRVVGTVPPKSPDGNQTYAIQAQPAADVAGAMAAVRMSVQGYAQRVIGLSDPWDGNSVAKVSETLAAIDEVKRDWRPARAKKNGASDDATASDETAIAAGASAPEASADGAARVTHAPIEIEGPRTNGTATSGMNG